MHNGEKESATVEEVSTNILILFHKNFQSVQSAVTCMKSSLLLQNVLTALTTVLASCTAGAWSTMEGLWQVVWVWNGELVGQGHGPGGCPGMGQRGESVLIWGAPTGTIVVMERQVGHVWGRKKQTDLNFHTNRKPKVCPALLCNSWQYRQINRYRHHNILGRLVVTANSQSRSNQRMFTYYHRGLRRYSNTVQRRWSCSRCVGCSRPSTGCWHIYGLLCGRRSLLHDGTASQPHQNLRTKRQTHFSYWTCHEELRSSHSITAAWCRIYKVIWIIYIYETFIGSQLILTFKKTVWSTTNPNE